LIHSLIDNKRISSEDPHNSVQSDEKKDIKTEDSTIATDLSSKPDKPKRPPSPEDDFEALAQRFAALKKR